MFFISCYSPDLLFDYEVKPEQSVTKYDTKKLPLSPRPPRKLKVFQAIQLPLILRISKNIFIICQFVYLSKFYVFSLKINKF